MVYCFLLLLPFVGNTFLFPFFSFIFQTKIKLFITIIYNKLINFFYSYDFYKKDDYDFESTILLNLDDIFRDFIHIFPNFNLDCSSKVYFAKYANSKKNLAKKNNNMNKNEKKQT